MAATKTPYANSPLQKLARRRNMSLRNVAAMRAKFKSLQNDFPITDYLRVEFNYILQEQEQKIKDVYEEQKTAQLRIQSEIDYFNIDVPKMGV